MTKSAASMSVKRGHLQPSLGVQCKVGSILVHVEEGLSDKGHPFDMIALRSLLSDHDVQAWMNQLRRLALLPVKR